MVNVNIGRTLKGGCYSLKMGNSCLGLEGAQMPGVHHRISRIGSLVPTFTFPSFWTTTTTLSTLTAAAGPCCHCHLHRRRRILQQTLPALVPPSSHSYAVQIPHVARQWDGLVDQAGREAGLQSQRGEALEHHRALACVQGRAGASSASHRAGGAVACVHTAQEEDSDR